MPALPVHARVRVAHQCELYICRGGVLGPRVRVSRGNVRAVHDVFRGSRGGGAVRADHDVVEGAVGGPGDVRARGGATGHDPRRDGGGSVYGGGVSPRQNPPAGCPFGLAGGGRRRGRRGSGRPLGGASLAADLGLVAKKCFRVLCAELPSTTVNQLASRSGHPCSEKSIRIIPLTDSITPSYQHYPRTDIPD